MPSLSAPDGLRLAYDATDGPGPVLLLLHGFGDDRRLWHAAGVVSALAADFRVVTLDLRGCGASDAPDDPAAYTVAAHLADIAAVAEAVGVARFLVWGWSFGASLALYLAAREPRVVAAVSGGTVFGPVYTPERGRALLADAARLLAARDRGDTAPLTPGERAFLARPDLPAYLARRRAFVAWPGVEPGAIRAPLFVYTGTADEPTVSRLDGQRAALAAAGIPLEVFPGLDHRQLVTATDVVLPPVRAFLRRHAAAQR